MTDSDSSSCSNLPPYLRVISLHGIGGGVGVSTLALALADILSTDASPVLILELDPNSPSLVDGAPFLAPNAEGGYDDLRATRRRLDADDGTLPCLRRPLNQGEKLRPTDFTENGVYGVQAPWRLADGNAGAGRVFCVPAETSRDLLGDSASDIRDVLESIRSQTPFRTVILDTGSSILDLKDLVPDFDHDPGDELTFIDGVGFGDRLLLTWIPVLVTDSRRSNLRHASRLYGALSEDAFYRSAFFVLNRLDSDLANLLRGDQRSQSGDLMGTLFSGGLSPFGAALVQRGCTIPHVDGVAWDRGGLMRGAMLPYISHLVAPLRRAEYAQLEGQTDLDPSLLMG